MFGNTHVLKKTSYWTNTFQIRGYSIGVTCIKGDGHKTNIVAEIYKQLYIFVKIIKKQEFQVNLFFTFGVISLISHSPKLGKQAYHEVSPC